MNNPYVTVGSRRLPWQRSVAAAVALAISGAIVAPVALAQSTTVGNVYGQVAASTGDTVTIKNQDTGVERTSTVGSNGRFFASSLPPGRYLVTLNKGGVAVSKLVLDVLAGRGSEAVFTTELEEVVVTGAAAAIDVSTTNNGSVFTSALLAEIPVANQDLNGIMNLAANTVKADARYDGGITIAGGGPSENAYYINGFAVTNPLTQLGSMELPYGAIKQAQIQTGGFGAEFGRSVGGVVNVITKSGGSEWKGGMAISWEPKDLRTSPHNRYYANTGDPANAGTDGTLYSWRKDNTRDSKTYSANIGGPLIADKLFVFMAGDFEHTDANGINAVNGSASAPNTGWLESRQNNTRYLGKVDWYINDNNRLEATVIGDNYKNVDNFFGFNYTTLKPTSFSYTEKSKNLGGTTPGVGGDAQILRYVGTLMDNLTVTAMYGQSQFDHSDSYSAEAGVTSPQVFFSTASNRRIDPRLANQATLIPANKLPAATTGIAPGAEETTKSYRFDVEWALGAHTLRAGVDYNDLKSIGAGDITLSPKTADSFAPAFGSGTWFRYQSTGLANANTFFLGSSFMTRTLAQNGATPANNLLYYVRAREFGDITDAGSHQSAQYLEDRWQVTDNFLVTGGIRNEGFYNTNGDGQKFLEVDSFISPRLAASWDVHGNSSLKVYGSAGRYSLQVPTHIAVRGASRSLLIDRYYTYTGVNAAGAPTGLTPLGPWFSGNNEFGQAKDPRSVAATGIKPTYQDEITAGIDFKVTPDYVAGAMFTYRKLKASMDDFCDYRPIDTFAAANNIDLHLADFYPFGCATINVGAANTLFLDPDGANDDGGTDLPAVKFDLTAAELGLPKPKRNYVAVNLYLEHPLKDRWYGKLTYTWSKSRGNTEGQTKSDNAQQDVAVTSTWDFAELMENSYGNLPGDRRHQIKGVGYFQLTPEFSLGGSLQAESGRPKNCFGTYGGNSATVDPGTVTAYGPVFFFCGGEPSPRGSAGNLPWNYSLDLSAAYKPSAMEGVTLRADIFNVTNSQKPTGIDEDHDDSSTALLPAFGTVRSYSAPRTIRFSVSYDF
jgi:hypothetical protein